PQRPRLISRAATSDRYDTSSAALVYIVARNIKGVCFSASIRPDKEEVRKKLCDLIAAIVGHECSAFNSHTYRSPMKPSPPFDSARNAMYPTGKSIRKSSGKKNPIDANAEV